MCIIDKIIKNEHNYNMLTINYFKTVKILKGANFGGMASQAPLEPLLEVSMD